MRQVLLHTKKILHKSYFSLVTKVDMTSNNIVVIGSCNIDFVTYALRLPKAGETIRGNEFVTNFGGKGANQCVATARLGAKPFFVARVGDDIWGTKYIENLKKENINVEHVKTTKNSHTGIAQIIVSKTGENQIVIVAGANSKLCVADIVEAKELIRTAAVLILQLETPLETVVKALEICEGVSILNAAPAETQESAELFRLPTIFCVNETEASLFTDISVNSIKEAEIAATHLLSKGCNSVLITLGSQGAVFIDKRDNKFYQISSPQVKSVDSTGAGDVFVGALGYLLAKKEFQMSKCIEIACIVAAESVKFPGAQESFPNAEFIKLLLKEKLKS